jgi:hypothetical protein
MRYETISYYPLKPPFARDEIEKQLPDSIVRELLHGPYLVYLIVESHKTDVVQYLDQKFRIGQTKDFRKRIALEVDKSEIPNFSHFFIDPRALEWGREVFCNIIRPTCESEACRFGVQMLRPVRIPIKKAKNLGIAAIGRPWDDCVELILSPYVKNLFESEGITGLDYEPCEFYDANVCDEPDLTPPYLAIVTTATGRLADDIVMGEGTFICKKHAYLNIAFIMFNERTHREALSGDDFQMTNWVIIKDKKYYYAAPRLIVSRRVLQLLLKHKIRGLTGMGFFLGEKFLPLVLTDEALTPEEVKALKPLKVHTHEESTPDILPQNILIP